MNEETKQEKPLIEVDKIINFNNLKNNDVIFFKVHDLSDGVMLALREISTRYKETLRAKNISIMIIPHDTTIDILDEKEMASMGWEKKDKNRIITLS